MGLFANVSQDLKCPYCGHTTPAADTEMQTKIFSHEFLLSNGEVKVGDEVEVDYQTCGGYKPLRDTHTDGDITVLEVWTCQHCSRNFLWAAVRIKDDRIVSIEPVELTKKVLEQADFISRSIAHLFPDGRWQDVKSRSKAELREAIREANDQWLARFKKQVE